MKRPFLEDTGMIVRATVEWEMNTVDNHDCQRVAMESLRSVLPGNLKIKIIKTTPTEELTIRLKRIDEFTLDEVFSKIKHDNKREEFKDKNNNSHFVKMNSQRYFVFQKSQECVACGVKGIKFVLEKNVNDHQPHFNLYAMENEKLLLMTKDHIVPRSKGGSDRLDNYETMCITCNNLKAHHYLTHDKIKTLRLLWNESSELAIKNRSKLIDEKRKELLKCSNQKGNSDTHQN